MQSISWVRRRRPAAGDEPDDNDNVGEDDSAPFVSPLEADKLFGGSQWWRKKYRRRSRSSVVTSIFGIDVQHYGFINTCAK